MYTLEVPAGQIIEKLIESKIYGGLMWDVGISWNLLRHDDDLTPELLEEIESQTSKEESINQQATQMALAAVKFYPESKFAIWWAGVITDFHDKLEPEFLMELHNLNEEDAKKLWRFAKWMGVRHKLVK